METDRIEKPLRELRELLKTLPEDPTPEEVHKLRTRTRRIEAIASALEPAARKESRRLLRTLKPVRKAAGTVRDMDVLTTDLLHLKDSNGNHSYVRLIEHLGTMRSKNAGDLLDTVAEQRKPALRQLKEYSRLFADSTAGKKPVHSEGKQSADADVIGGDAGAAVSSLTDELTHWPVLNAGNLHAFRLKAKELRYVLQMFPATDQRLVNALARVKDEIGEWHDWQQLDKIAREVLDADNDCELLAQIVNAEEQKLSRALNAANRLRRNYLQMEPQRRAKAS